jgi:hypothetical protein
VFEYAAEFPAAEQNQLVDDKWNGKTYQCTTVVGTKRAGSFKRQFEESALTRHRLRRHSPVVAKPVMAVSSVAVEATSPNVPAKKKKKRSAATALAAAPATDEMDDVESALQSDVVLSLEHVRELIKVVDDKATSIDGFLSALKGDGHAEFQALQAFAGKLIFKDCNARDERLVALRARAQQCRHFGDASLLERGKVWAELVRDMHERAYVVDRARKVALGAVYGVLNAALGAQQLLESEADKLLGRVDLRRCGIATALLVELGARCDVFSTLMQSTVLATLPLDMFNALFGQKRHWYSDRHYWLLQSACKCGYVDAQVRALVASLGTEKLTNLSIGAHLDNSAERGKQREPSLAEKLHEIETTMREVVDASAVSTGGMLNKRFEWMVAVSPVLEIATEPFMTPLFWVDVKSGATSRALLHFVDLSAVPLTLQLCTWDAGTKVLDKVRGLVRRQ